MRTKIHPNHLKFSQVYANPPYMGFYQAASWGTCTAEPCQNNPNMAKYTKTHKAHQKLSITINNSLKQTQARENVPRTPQQTLTNKNMTTLQISTETINTKAH